MVTRNLGLTRPGIFTVGMLAWALVLLPPSDARAITFGEWATGQGWPDDVAPDVVYAANASIDSLAGIGDYDWTTTPTTYLDLSSNQITSVESGDFAGLGNLTSDCPPTKSRASNRCVHRAGNLTTLYLSSNQITSLESGAFTGLGNLTSLNLSSNEITSLESDAFSGLGNLTDMDSSQPNHESRIR